MTITRRRALMSAALLAGVPLTDGALAPDAAAAGGQFDLENWTLVDSLSDEFDTALDPDRWHKGLWYPGSHLHAFRDDNVQSEAGNLRLYARKEYYAGKGYTFGAVESVFDTPGVCSYVEVRAKCLAGAANVLSAIWLQSSRLDGVNHLLADPNPEIDIQENTGDRVMQAALHLWPGNDEARHVRYGGNANPNVGVDVTADYHLYGAERRDGMLRLYFDRQLLWELRAPDPSLWRMSRHVVFSLEAHRGWPNDAGLPASFDIDYVHTYYRTPETVQADGEYRIVESTTGRRLVRTENGPVLSGQAAEADDASRWRLTRQDDFTYVLSAPDGAGTLGLGALSGYPGTAVVINQAGVTGPDSAGSVNRWHVLPGTSAPETVRLLSKFAGLSLVSGEDGVMVGEDDVDWTLEEIVPPTPEPEPQMPAYVAASKARPGAMILTGDWDGDGVVTYAVRIGTRVVFYNENRVDAPVAAAFTLGRARDTVYVGDWNGDGSDSLALKRGNRVFLQVTASFPVTVVGTLADLDKARR
ncbi:glycoside hydrolase family 16 protein [Actinomyces sp.]|uniref:glycoside hydrolase family 16 protein n=1 Tax=Actinomyces sp. TaxID=29317 RepID=UPI0026DD5EC0|nr:glycoside hydrolase family 16 protein [Actinomyces sp.]MDO4901261.1 glycoside hydrolase family 16 protein [Actinomyces sp.]